MAQSRFRTPFINGASMGATVSGTGVDIAGFNEVGMVSTYTGTPTGTFSFEVSNDSTDGVNGTWAPITADKGTATAPNGAGAGNLWAVQFAPIAFRWIRASFTRSAGTGSWTVWLFARQNP
jgi:hypothetical protein